MMTTSSTGQRRRIVGDIYHPHDFLVVTKSSSSSSSSTSSSSSSLLTSTNHVESWIHNKSDNNKTDNPSAILMTNHNLWNSKLLLLPAADSSKEDWVDVLFEDDYDDNGSSINLLTSTMMRFCVDDEDDDDHHHQQQQQDSDEMIRTLTLEDIIDVAIATIKTYQEQPFGTTSSTAIKDDTTTNQTITVISTVIDHKGKLSDLQNERVIIKKEKVEEEENNSTCSSTLDDWEEVFGEDGSISENCCDCEQQLLRRLPFTMIETNNNNEEEAGGREEEEEEDYDVEVLNPTTENWDSLFGQDDDNDDKQKEEGKKSDLRLSSTKSIVGTIFGETSDSDIHSRYDMLNRSSSLMTDESSSGEIDDDKEKENPRSCSTSNNTQVLPPPGFTSSCQKMVILHVNTNCTVTTTKTKTTSINNNTNNVSNKRILPANNKDETGFSKEAQSKQKQQQQQYDSVWDVHFQQGEEENLTTIVVPINDSGTVVSDTPEDWEALLDDDDEESVSGTRNREKEEEVIPPHDDILVVPVPANDGVSMVSDTPEDWEALLEDDDENEPATRSKGEEILLQDDIIGAQENDVFPSKIAKKRISIPAKNIDKDKISKRAQSKQQQQQQQQYDSVWDMTFQEKENLPTTIVSMHDERTIISNAFACLEGNPDPPEDWEAMLADEEECVSGTRSKEIPLRDDIVTTTQEVEAFRSRIFAIENPLTLTEKKKEKTEIPRKEISERQDCATTSKKNLRPCWKIESSISYTSVWEMCSKANDQCRLDHNHDRATTSSSSKSTTSLMLKPHHCSEPQVEWEDLYS